MKTIIKTVIGLCSLVLLTPALVHAQEAKLFYAQGHSNTGSHHRVIVVSDDGHDRHRGRRHYGHGNGHGYGHNNGHHVHYNGCGHYVQRNDHVYNHYNRHDDNRRHHGRRSEHHENRYYGQETHRYNSGPEIERVYVNPQLFR